MQQAVVTTPAELELLGQNKDIATCEVTPQHLTLAGEEAYPRLGTLAAHADPEHRLSPFSAQTREMRERDMQFFERALVGSRIKVNTELGRHLPRILWMYQMGLILFWIYDRSASQQRTHALVEKSLGIVVRLIKISEFPLLRPVRRMVVDLVETMTSE